MSNLVSADTGIDGIVVWVSAGAALGDGDAWRGPSMKVAIGNKIAPEKLDAAITVALADPPEFFGKLPDNIKSDVVKFVALNREVLMRYWTYEISTREMVNGIKNFD